MTLDEFVIGDLRTDAMRASLLRDQTSRTAIHYREFGALMGVGSGDSGDGDDKRVSKPRRGRRQRTK